MGEDWFCPQCDTFVGCGDVSAVMRRDGAYGAYHETKRGGCGGPCFPKDQHTPLAEALRAENERLRGLVEAAHMEGYRADKNSLNWTQAWKKSDVKRRLEDGR